MSEKSCRQCHDLARRVAALEAKVEELTTLIDGAARAPAIHAYATLARADVQALRRRRENPQPPAIAG